MTQSPGSFHPKLLHHQNTRQSTRCRDTVKTSCLWLLTVLSLPDWNNRMHFDTLKKWRTFKTFCMINYDTQFSSKMRTPRNLAIGVIGNLLPFSLALGKAFAAIGDLTSLFLGPPSITQTNWSHCLPNHHRKFDGHFKQKSKAPLLRKKSRN